MFHVSFSDSTSNFFAAPSSSINSLTSIDTLYESIGLCEDCSDKMCIDDYENESTANIQRRNKMKSADSSDIGCVESTRSCSLGSDNNLMKREESCQNSSSADKSDVLTRNPFLNFLKLFRKQNSELTAVQVVTKGAKV